MREQTLNQLCGAIHGSTGARCEKPVEHLENHIGQFLHGTVQWPKEESSRLPTDAEINRLEKAAWDAGVDQALVYLRDERDTLTARCEALEAEAETERIKLAACTTAAFGNTPDRVAERLAPGHPYWSASYGDVCGAVDREMALRVRCEALEQEVARSVGDEDHTSALLQSVLQMLGVPAFSKDYFTEDRRWNWTPIRALIDKHRDEKKSVAARCEALQLRFDTARTAVNEERELRQQAEARCEALEKQAAEFKRIGQDFERDYRNTFEQSCKNLERAEKAEKRCASLEQERDQTKLDHVHACQTIAQMHAVAVGEVTGPKRGVVEDVADLRARCQHLEQAVRDIVAADFLQVAGVRQPIWVRWNEALRIANAALASLLPSQDETPRTDENRVSFAAGYTAALDDALKGKTHD
jgi:hypothetical protein